MTEYKYYVRHKGTNKIVRVTASERAYLIKTGEHQKSDFSPIKGKTDRGLKALGARF